MKNKNEKTKISKSDIDFMMSRFEQWGVWLEHPLEGVGFSSRSVLVDMIEYRTKVTRSITKPNSPNYTRDRFNSATAIVLAGRTSEQIKIAYNSWARHHCTGDKRLTGEALWRECAMSKTKYYRVRHDLFTAFYHDIKEYEAKNRVNKHRI